MFPEVRGITVAILVASPETSRLELGYQQRGVTGFMLVVRELEQEQGTERTAEMLVVLAGEPKSNAAAAAAHGPGRMGEGGRAVLPKLAKALCSSEFPADMLNELGPGDIPRAGIPIRLGHG